MKQRRFARRKKNNQKVGREKVTRLFVTLPLFSHCNRKVVANAEQRYSEENMTE